MKDFKIHDGGKAPVLPPIVDPFAQAVILGGDDDKPKAIARVSADDVIEHGVLAYEGPTFFFVGKGKEWGSFSKSRDVLAISVLRDSSNDGSGSSWAPIVGARVVLRFKPNFDVLDLCTRGDGSTIGLPARVFPMDTPLGRMLHCPVMKGDEFRLELEAPGFEPRPVRVVLHTMRADVT